ncbi:VOC family protein [Parerythrobacter jejuensis]|uniref:Glyoxalase n=1 Tax=Parerythrobacter jejuensis TaxID=795812 RepID=A0A845AQ95_9SPHN|nr:VOC family protein [Parerythrobacter jejuensis]MXP30262.1 glyoxalase [Parerythrobacter jejuensis]MXP33022.1 glyoxalase [Parerythrobacter jejuensis]
MAVLGLDHVQLSVPKGGEDEARAFFVGVLGMQEVAKPANLSPKGCWFESGSLNLHIGIDPDFRPATKAHPALLVDDLADLRKRLNDAGYATNDDMPVEGYDRFFTSDPFGNRIELMQKL